MPLPANTPASFKAECGSCHLAYPPALLAGQGLAEDHGRAERPFRQRSQRSTPKPGRKSPPFSNTMPATPSKLGGAGEPPRITPNRPIRPQAPRSPGQNLARPARQIGGQLRSLPPRRRQWQLSANTKSPCRQRLRDNHAKNSRLGLAGAPRPLADGRRLLPGLADRRKAKPSAWCTSSPAPRAWRRHFSPALGLHRLALCPLCRFRARAGCRQGLPCAACSSWNRRTTPATIRPAAGPSCCCSASAS